MHRIRRHLTFANVVSVIALFAVLGGGAYAVTTAPKNSVVSRSIKNGQVKGPDVNESSLGTVPSANPAAFARVSATGAISRSKGINAAATTISGDATYCFHGLAFQPRGGQATVDYNGNPGGERFVELGVGGVGGCPASTQAFVWIHNVTGSDVPMPFFVVFYR
jgi:hypothetical protein